MYGNGDWKRPSGEVEQFYAWRPPIMRDWGRVLHSASFRRLQGKTQLFPGHESDFFRNRLTHSLEVAQIAEGIALRLNHENSALKGDGIDPRLCAAAALLHDLGHPPFGHNGERALDDAMKQVGGFEGNAQTLRIITALEKKQKLADGSCAGMDLTFRLLASVLKYDKKIPARRPRTAEVSKGYYLSEANLVSEIKRQVAPGWTGADFKTIECQIMDIADDIAYSVFDLEDSFKAGFVDPSTILRSSPELFDRVAAKVNKALGKKSVDGVEVYLEFADIFECIEAAEQYNCFLVDFTEASSISHALASDSFLRTKFSSQLVGMAIASVDLKYDRKFPMLSKVNLGKDAARRVEVLKHFTFEATVRSSRVKIAEYRGYEIVKQVFEALSSSGGHLLMPDDIKSKHENASGRASKMRVICDFIAGMTDRYAVEFWSRLHSDAAKSIFVPF